jgi:hypothetical protein
MEELAKILGFGPPFAYGGMAYGFFLLLDRKLSSEAKAVLAGLVRLRDLDDHSVANALMEVFDTLYGRSLLSWRAFATSLLFTLAVSVVFTYEAGLIGLWFTTDDAQMYFARAMYLQVAVNVVGDYLALFPIRGWLGLKSRSPVISLIIGSIIGVAIIFVFYCVRYNVSDIWTDWWPTETYSEAAKQSGWMTI